MFRVFRLQLAVLIFGLTALAQTPAPTPPVISFINNDATPNAPVTPVAPGELVYVFGTNLGDNTQTSCRQSSGNLVSTCNGITVTFGGKAAWFFNESGARLSIEVPVDLTGTSAQVVVTRVVSGQTLTSQPFTVQIALTSPELYGSLNTSNNIFFGQCFDSSNTAITSSNPAAPGGTVTCQGSGFGVANPAVLSGTVTPSSPASTIVAPVTLLFGNQSIAVTATLLPGSVGVDQIVFTVPQNARLGPATMQLSVGGVASQMVWLYVVPTGPDIQTITLNNLSATLTLTDNGYATTLTGTGTATLSPGGPATISVTASYYDSKAPACSSGNIAVISILVQANATDSFTIGYTGTNTIALSSANLASSFNGGGSVTASTGPYSGNGGTAIGGINLTLTAQNTVTLAGSGTVSLSNSTAISPVIFPGGVAPIYSTVPIVQPGSWISIYGAGFGSTTSVWNNDFPTSLGGIHVSIDGKPAYLWIVSPGQINAQVPADATTGCVTVNVSNAAGNGVISGVILEPQQPSLSLLGDGKHVVGVIPTPDGSGAYGSGVNSYDLVGPAGAFSYKTRPVKRGEALVLYGVGFGPTQTAVAPGQAYTSATTLARPLTGVVLGSGSTGVSAPIDFAGLVGAGLYQINLRIPQNAPTGDVPVVAGVSVQNAIVSDNSQTQANVLVTVQ